LSGNYIKTLSQAIENELDVSALIQSLPELETKNGFKDAETSNTEKTVRIGVAMDKAFCFYYQDNLDLLAAAGAEIICFSPMKDARLPERINGLYFGGGYPELYADQLAENETLRHQVKDACEKGMPIYGECGGFMYLCSAICDLEGQTHPMTGCFPFGTKMFNRLKSLGYREVTLAKQTIIGKRGQTIRGHEFHYSELTNSDGSIDTVYDVTSRNSISKVPEGYQIKRTLGSYNHLHFGSRPEAVRTFVQECETYKKETNP
jgi:cobyrinic acid a,c-diamide synthase